MRTSKNRRAGVTLLELLVVMALMALLTVAISYAFIAGLDMERANARRTVERDRTEAMEQRITLLLQGAKLADDAADTTTFFVGATTGGGDASGDLGCDQLTFTTTAPGIPLAAQSSEDDFETQHRARGSLGGVAEVSLSTTPSGEDAGDRTGLFERIQRPSDGDSTQGGTESLLSPQVTAIGFQFWDGQQWVAAWDTETGERRLPAAVRVSYRVESSSSTSEDAQAVRVLVVPLPTSDIDGQNPATGTPGAATGA